MDTKSNQEDITPENSVVPIYLEPLTNEEQQERMQLEEDLLAQKTQAEQIKSNALTKLQKLGLTEEEAKAIIGL